MPAINCLFLILCFVSSAYGRPPPGIVYNDEPDPLMVVPNWVQPYTGPDISISFYMQNGTNFPEQVALFPAVKDGSYLFVQWITPEFIDIGPGIVWYGPDAGNVTNSSSCNPKSYTYGKGSVGEYQSGMIYACIIGPLLPSTLYYYQINGSDSIFNFTSVPLPGPQSFKFAIMADVGQTVNSSITLDHVAESSADFVIYAGDLSYADNYQTSCSNFNGTDNGYYTCGEGGLRWDSWGRLAQKVLAYKPAAYVPGNHDLELNYHWREYHPYKAYRHRTPSLLDTLTPFDDFAPYVEKWKLPGGGWPANSPLFYSLDIGPVHLIGLDSYSSFVKYSHQEYWLKDDLCSINRNVTPWVVVFMHVPWYNSDEAHYLEGEPSRKMFEKHLYQAGVDLVISGHVHAYERSHPVYDMKLNECGPIHVTVGDGGNDEGIAGPFLDPKPIYSAYREDSFGYAELEIIDEKTAIYSWYRNQDNQRVLIDSFDFQSKINSCGPFMPSFCPSTPPEPLSATYSF